MYSYCAYPIAQRRAFVQFCMNLPQMTELKRHELAVTICAKLQQTRAVKTLEAITYAHGWEILTRLCSCRRTHRELIERRLYS